MAVQLPAVLRLGNGTAPNTPAHTNPGNQIGPSPRVQFDLVGGDWHTFGLGGITDEVHNLTIRGRLRVDGQIDPLDLQINVYGIHPHGEDQHNG